MLYNVMWIGFSKFLAKGQKGTGDKISEKKKAPKTGLFIWQRN